MWKISTPNNVIELVEQISGEPKLTLTFLGLDTTWRFNSDCATP